MKYYSLYHSHELFELQESLSGLSKSNRWVKLADNLPWDKIEKGWFFVMVKYDITDVFTLKQANTRQIVNTKMLSN